MTLIKSISGIRGTIGGKSADNLTPIDVVKFTAAFGEMVKKQNPQPTIVVGRDARMSGDMINSLIINTLSAQGIQVIDLDLSTTPTVEVMVPKFNADAGIIITASHNPKQWNALKLLNSSGEFISDNEGKKLIKIADSEDFYFAEVDYLGEITHYDKAIEGHIEMILKMELVDAGKVADRKFKIVVDAVNSTGGIAVPQLLKSLGCDVVEIYCTPNGNFPHNPEPLAENLTEISKKVVEEKADLGVVVDPDVDRLALINQDGSMFGEEYTLVAIADYILANNPGPTVSNLSSSRALRDITEKYGQEYYAAAVGEVNVVHKMKEVNAVIGGEGNGGIIDPALHYGRDALVGIALFLTYFSEKNVTMTELKASYPQYAMSKNKINLTEGIDPEDILQKLQNKYEKEVHSMIDGLKIDFENEWVHMRKSNTEPIIRIYTESDNEGNAEALAKRFLKEIEEIASV